MTVALMLLTSVVIVMAVLIVAEALYLRRKHRRTTLFYDEARPYDLEWAESLETWRRRCNASLAASRRRRRA